MLISQVCKIIYWLCLYLKFVRSYIGHWPLHAPIDDYVKQYEDVLIPSLYALSCNIKSCGYMW